MFKTLDDLIADRHGLAGKPVLVREDLNVPIHEGRVSDDTRLRAAMPTLAELADHGAKVLVLAHFGRPKGKVDPEFTLRPIAHALSDVMGRPVGFLESPDRHAIDVLDPGSITVLENSRFFPGEEKNDPVLAKQIASLGDFYVNDAFSAAHRAHVTTEGLAHVLPAFAGRQMEAELKALEAALGKPEHPVAAVVGGSKVSTKLDVLTNLVGKVDHLIIGGGMANTFLAARGSMSASRFASMISPIPPTPFSTPPMPQAAPCTCPMTWWWPRNSARTCVPHRQCARGRGRRDDPRCRRGGG